MNTNQSHFSIRNTRNSRNNLEPKGFDLLRNENTEHVTMEKHVTNAYSHIFKGYKGYNIDFIIKKLVTHVKIKKVTGLQNNLSTITELSKSLFLPLAIALRNNRSYANRIQQKAVGLALAGYVVNGAYSPLRAFFMRNISMHSHIFMARLERDTFECAGNRLHLSANPFQLCHPHLAVNGKASFKVNGAHTHA